MATYENGESEVKKFLAVDYKNLKEVSILTERYRKEPDLAIDEIVKFAASEKSSAIFNFNRKDFKSAIIKWLQYENEEYVDNGYCDEVVLRTLKFMNATFKNNLKNPSNNR